MLPAMRNHESRRPVLPCVKKCEKDRDQDPDGSDNHRGHSGIESPANIFKGSLLAGSTFKHSLPQPPKRCVLFGLES